MVGLGEAMANGRAFADVWAARSDDVAGLASAEEGTITGKERGRAGEEFCVRALVCRAFGSVGHGRVLLVRVGLVWAVCVGSMLRGGPAWEGQGQIHGLAQTWYGPLLLPPCFFLKQRCAWLFRLETKAGARALVGREVGKQRLL
jgi:hypothetical protein